MGIIEFNYASKIYLWQNFSPIRNRLEYSWTITTENEESMLSTKNCAEIEGNFIDRLISDGNAYFRHLSDWRKKVELIAEVPKEEIFQKRYLPHEIRNFDFKQQGLNPSDLEKALKLFRG